MSIVFFLLASLFCAANTNNDTSAITNPTELLKKIIQYPSVSGSEKKLGEFLLKTSEQMGFHIRLFTAEDSSFNFAASLYPLSLRKPNILFINHIDVVQADDSSLWRKSPFAGIIENDTVWGRGAIDMKGIAVMQLFAAQSMLEEAKKKDLPYNITVLFLAGEEAGGKKGGKIITDKFLDELNPVSVFGEGGVGLKNVLPSKPDKLVFFMSVAEKKNLWLMLHLKMDSQGHASVPSTKNVNKIMFKAISRFEQRKPEIDFSKTSRRMFRRFGEANGGIQGFVLKHINWIVLRPFRRNILSREPLLLSTVTNTIQLTSVQNPYCPPNKIACQVAAYYDCRLLPSVKTKYFLKNVFFKLINPKIQVEVLDESPDAKPSDINAYYLLMEQALKQNYPGAEVIPTLFPASTDNDYFRSHDIPAFGIMPIELDKELLESIHGSNERISIDNLNKGIKTYSTFIQLLIKEDEKIKVKAAH